MASSPTARGDLGVVEQRADLERLGAIRDEGIGQDLGEITARLDLAHHVVDEDLLLVGAEEALQKVVGVGHSRQYTDMEPKPEVMRFAERTVRGRDDHGEEEIVTIWIDRLPGAVWSVGRAINLAHRETPVARPDDVLWSGYELGDATRAANEALESDLDASEDNDDHNRSLRPFTDTELLQLLERWFFDHA